MFALGLSLAACSSGSTSAGPTTTTTSPGCAAIVRANLAYNKAIEQSSATAASLATATTTMRQAVEAAKGSLPPHAAKQASYAAEELATISQHLTGSSPASFPTDLATFHATLKNLRAACAAHG
jgi:methyl-accepting chemotaxis protein